MAMAVVGRLIVMLYCSLVVPTTATTRHGSGGGRISNNIVAVVGG